MYTYSQSRRGFSLIGAIVFVALLGIAALFASQAIHRQIFLAKEVRQRGEVFDLRNLVRSQLSCGKTLAQASCSLAAQETTISGYDENGRQIISSDSNEPTLIGNKYRVKVTCGKHFGSSDLHVYASWKQKDGSFSAFNDLFNGIPLACATPPQSVCGNPTVAGKKIFVWAETAYFPTYHAHHFAELESRTGIDFELGSMEVGKVYADKLATALADDRYAAFWITDANAVPPATVTLLKEAWRDKRKGLVHMVKGGILASGTDGYQLYTTTFGSAGIDNIGVSSLLTGLRMYPVGTASWTADAGGAQLFPHRMTQNIATPIQQPENARDLYVGGTSQKIANNAQGYTFVGAHEWDGRRLVLTTLGPLLDNSNRTFSIGPPPTFIYGPAPPLTDATYQFFAQMACWSVGG